MKDSQIYYSIGALLYCPANNEGIVKSITQERFGDKYSMALCLEDTISDKHVEEAEDILAASLNKIYESMATKKFYIPKIFVRVRRPEQIQCLYRKFGKAIKLVTGFIIPKFDLDNADTYINEIVSINKVSTHKIYMMPILESRTIVSIKNRYDILYTLKDKLDAISDYVLNIRVGGNDLCHAFGFRRRMDESIHQIGPIADILSDVVTVFGMDYVVSGPVWEYYNGDDWEKGFITELKHDRLIGIVGKTVIHPNQIKYVNEAYKVSKDDYEDARSILNWDSSSSTLVHGGSGKKRMNEYKTHFNWAQRIMFLAEYYGVE